ncbi:MAG: polysaccharide biosynthesis C-terminal domain-containing protein, partial [Bacteroidota bacterium]
FLYSEWLDEAEFGVIELLLAFAVVSTEFSLLGGEKIATRFFPYFKDNKEKQGKFVSFVASYMLLGFVLVSLILLIIRPWVIAEYAEKAPLFSSRFIYLLPFCFGFASFRVLQAFSQALLKSVVPNFAFHVAMRLFHAGIIILYYFDYLDFERLLMGYVLGYSVPGFLIAAYLIWLKKLAFSFSLDFWKTRIAKIIIVYGLFVLLADASMVLLGRIDAMMIGKILGEIPVGAYGIALYIANLVTIPKRAISNIVAPLIAIRYKERNWKEIGMLYQRNAMVNLLLGGLVLIGIWANIDSFFTLMPKHIAGRDAAILIGAGFLFSIAAGPNRQIIIVSRHFRFDLYLNIALLIIAIIGNYFLIPRYGLAGAAFATAFTLSLYNIAGIIFVYLKFKVFPYTLQSLTAVVVLVLVLVFGLNTPMPENQILAILARSISMASIFGIIVYVLNLLPEANQLVDKYLGRKGMSG